MASSSRALSSNCSLLHTALRHSDQSLALAILLAVDSQLPNTSNTKAFPRLTSSIRNNRICNNLCHISSSTTSDPLSKADSNCLHFKCPLKIQARCITSMRIKTRRRADIRRRRRSPEQALKVLMHRSRRYHILPSHLIV